MLPPPERLEKALAVSDYMLGAARLASDPDVVIAKMGHLLNEAGLPVDRIVSIVQLLNAESRASARYWEKGVGASHAVFGVTATTMSEFEHSPAGEANATGEWVIFKVMETPDERFSIVRTLKDAGYTHYICAPVFMATGMFATFNFATRAEQGFSDDDFALLRFLYPAMAASQEILATLRVLHEVTRMYVGDEPHRRILSGDVYRGQVMHMRAAILFADMRNFTALTSSMTAEQATQLLNDYYDCVVPAVESRGGEVLKLIADGVLAVFRTDDDETQACANAYAAAAECLQAIDARTAEPRFRAGCGLHLGEVAYGNVGSGMRLDYTVIGRDVNFASRIASLCGTMGEPLLVSDAFRQHLPNALPRSCGHHALKGLADPAEVFAPPIK